jgi:hypothetical protein
MLDQVARTSREYPVLPGTTEDQGVLWYMSTVLLTAFGFFYVATSFRPSFNHEGREHILQDAFTRQRSLVRAQHRLLQKRCALPVKRQQEGNLGNLPSPVRA